MLVGALAYQDQTRSEFLQYANHLNNLGMFRS